MTSEQGSVDDLVAEFADRHEPSVSDMIHILSEESGEVAEAYLRLNDRKLFADPSSKEDLATELADVAYTIRVIAYLADVDLDARLRSVAEHNLKREEATHV